MQELAGIGINPSLSLLSDDSESISTRLPSPRPKSPRHAAASVTASTPSFETGAPRSRRTHTRTRSSVRSTLELCIQLCGGSISCNNNWFPVQDFGLAAIAETDTEAAHRSSSRDLACQGGASVEIPAETFHLQDSAPASSENHAPLPQGHFSVCSINLLDPASFHCVIFVSLRQP